MTWFFRIDIKIRIIIILLNLSWLVKRRNIFTQNCCIVSGHVHRRRRKILLGRVGIGSPAFTLIGNHLQGFEARKVSS